MSASFSRQSRIGLAVALATASLAWGAIISPATEAAPPPATDRAATIQPRVAGSFDDTYGYIGKVLVGGGENASNPASVAIDDTIYVADSWSGIVAAIPAGQTSGSSDDTVTVTTGAPSSQDNGLFGIAVDTNDDTVYVVNRGYSTKTLWAINARTMTVSRSAVLNCSGAGHNSYTYRSIAVNSVDDTIYVPCDQTGGTTRGVLVAVNGKNLDDSLSVTSPSTPLYFSGVAVHPTSGKVYLGAWNDVVGTVRVYNGATLAIDDSFTAVPRPSDVTIADDTVYIASSSTNSVLARNTSSGSSVTLTPGATGSTALAPLNSLDLLFVGANWSAFLRGLQQSSNTSRFYSNVGVSSLAISPSGVIYAGSNGWWSYGGPYIYAKVPNPPVAPSATAGIEQATVT